MSDQVEVARAALAEISPAGTVGDLLERTADDDGVTTLSFVSTLSGYPGWHWSVSVAELPGEEPTVLEAELLPGEGALLAPDWVPWVDRLEEYRTAQAALAAEAGEAEADLDVDQLDDDDDEEHDGDDLGDDPDDGIDFEEGLDDELVEFEVSPSGLPPMGVDEQHEADAEPDDDGPEQPDQP